MTTITIDDEMINELVAVSHFKNAQEAVIKIIADYLQQFDILPALNGGVFRYFRIKKSCIATG